MSHGQIDDPFLQAEDEPRRHKYSHVGQGLLHVPIEMKDEEQEDNVLYDENGVFQVGEQWVPIVMLITKEDQEPRQLQK